MNAARIEKSERLQRLKAVLSDGLPHSSWELMQTCRVVAPATCVSELRHGGMAVECRRMGDVWFYRQVMA